MPTLKQKINELLEPKKNEHEPDKKLLIVSGIIIVFGLIMLFSASSIVAYFKSGDSYSYFKHQLMGLFLGLIAFWFFLTQLNTIMQSVPIATQNYTYLTLGTASYTAINAILNYFFLFFLGLFQYKLLCTCNKNP